MENKPFSDLNNCIGRRRIRRTTLGASVIRSRPAHHFEQVVRNVASWHAVFVFCAGLSFAASTPSLADSTGRSPFERAEELADKMIQQSEANGPSNQIVPSPVSVKYKPAPGRFSVMLPGSWSYEEQQPRKGLWVALSSSRDEGSADPFVENINIVVIKTAISDPDRELREGIALLRKNMPQFQLLESGVSMLGANNASWFTHTWGYQGEVLWALKASFLKNGMTYIVTCTALSSTADEFRPIFDEIISSIEFE